MPLIKAYNIDSDLHGLKSHSIFKSVYTAEASWKGTFGHLMQTASAESRFSLEDLRRRSIDPTLDFSTAYHPQTDGQTERVNKVLEDLLRACVLTFDRSWESSFPYVEFSYNNSHQASIKMSPFEALYGRKCQTPLMWSNVGEKALEGPAFVKEAEEKVALIRRRLLEAQSRQKSYADNRWRELRFEEGDFVYLKVSPMRGVRRFQVKGKLAPRFVGPYPIIVE
jgi:hypothetical protein